MSLCNLIMTERYMPSLSHKPWVKFRKCLVMFPHHRQAKQGEQIFLLPFNGTTSWGYMRLFWTCDSTLRDKIQQYQTKLFLHMLCCITKTVNHFFGHWMTANILPSCFTPQYYGFISCGISPITFNFSTSVDTRFECL